VSGCLYWIWFQELFGVGTARAHEVLLHCGHPSQLFSQSREELTAEGFLEDEELGAVLRKDLEPAVRCRDRAAAFGALILTPDSPDYPQALQGIFSKPLVLYALGDVSVFSGRYVITMVGTRHANAYGLRAAKNLGRELSLAGAVVVSGLAPGLDAACLEGAIEGGSPAAAVLGCGLDNPYPRGNQPLRRQILKKGGTVLTEYPIGTEPRPHHFPVRNRVMSGLAMGVAVVQAPRKSGALITVKHALEQGREVFAVPGEIYDPKMEGCVELIMDGAKPIRCAMDILEEYIPVYEYPLRFVSGVGMPIPAAAGPDPAQAPPPVFAKEIHRRIYEALLQGAATADAVAESTDMEIAQVLSALTELEIMGHAEPLPGRRYRTVSKLK
jgi:DNA processing protein